MSDFSNKVTRFSGFIKMIFISCVSLATLEHAAWAQDSFPAYEVPRSIIRTIKSEPLQRSYELYIKLPPKYNSIENKGRSYPVVYLNDGTYCFQTAAGVTHLPMNSGAYEHAILVGISYSQGDSGPASRSRDMTPTIPKNLSEGHGKQYEHGKASDYLAFLRDEVAPFIEENYRGDPERRILVGQSYGGLFGAYVLVTDPSAFSDYILTSTSFWHDDAVMFNLEKAFAAKNDSMPARVYFAVGENETEATGNKYMISNQEKFVGALKSHDYLGLEVRQDIIPETTHYTTFPVGLTRGLDWFLGNPKASEKNDTSKRK